MSEVKIIEILEDVNAENNRTADAVREMMKRNGTFFVNFMSSPGSGKTTLLTRLINMLKDEYKIGEMDVDIKSSVDAKRVADETGIRSMQIHNGGLCHIDADMTSRAIMEYGAEDLDILILENIGNLVCPAEFDTGAHLNICLLSIPEGDDKPLKYPLMFTVSDVVLLTKIDTLPAFDFDLEKAKRNILNLNPNAIIIPVSAKNGTGMAEVASLIKKEVEKIKNESAGTLC